MELGIQGSVFQLDYTQYDHLATDCWIKHLWKVVQDKSIAIEDDIKGEKLPRERDMMLSSKFLLSVKLGIISKSE